MSLFDVHVIQLNYRDPVNARLRQIAELTRRLAKHYLHRDITVEYFVEPIPAGLACLDSDCILLSMPLVQFCSLDAIVSVLRHEITHFKAPGDTGHGRAFYVAALRWRLTERWVTYDQRFLRLARIYADLLPPDERAELFQQT